MNIDELSPLQRQLWEVMPPEARITIEAYELDRHDAVAERRCVDVPKVGCGKAVDLDDLDAWAESKGYGEVPLEVKLEMIDQYEKTGVCPACFMEHMDKGVRMMLAMVSQRMAGMAGLN